MIALSVRLFFTKTKFFFSKSFPHVFLEKRQRYWSVFRVIAPLPTATTSWQGCRWSLIRKLHKKLLKIWVSNIPVPIYHRRVLVLPSMTRLIVVLELAWFGENKFVRITLRFRRPQINSEKKAVYLSHTWSVTSVIVMIWLLMFDDLLL